MHTFPNWENTLLIFPLFPVNYLTLCDPCMKARSTSGPRGYIIGSAMLWQIGITTIPTYKVTNHGIFQKTNKLHAKVVIMQNVFICNDSLGRDL